MTEFPQAACEPEVNLQKGNSMSQENNNPVHRVRLSTISAAVFKNTNADGKAYFNAQFDRSYKDGDEWKHTKSFGQNDLLNLAKVADLTHTWILEQQTSPKPDAADGPSPS